MNRKEMNIVTQETNRIMKEDCPCIRYLVSWNSDVLQRFFRILYQEICVSPLGRNPLLVGGTWCCHREQVWLCWKTPLGHGDHSTLCKGPAVEIWPQVAQAFHAQMSKLVQILLKRSHMSYTDNVTADPEKQLITGLRCFTRNTIEQQERQ